MGAVGRQCRRQPRSGVPGPYLAGLGGCPDTDGTAAGPPNRHHAGGGHGRQPDDPDLFPGLYEGRCWLRPLLRGHVLVHRVHARAHHGLQPGAAVRFLGAGGPVLLSAHRPLV